MKTERLLGRRGAGGQSLVEFAMTFPIVMMVLYFLGAFALLFYSFLTLQLAVREGTSSIVHNPRQTVSQVRNTVTSSLVTLDANLVTVTVEPSDPNTWISGVQVSVVAVYNFALPAEVLGSVQLRAVSVMTIE